MTNEDEGGNNCKANLRIGVKKVGSKGGDFLKGYWFLRCREARGERREPLWLVITPGMEGPGTRPFLGFSFSRPQYGRALNDCTGLRKPGHMASSQLDKPIRPHPHFV